MFAPANSLTEASRLRSYLLRGERLSAKELFILGTCGALAAVAASAIHFRLPGEAILRGALPMMLGLAAVPRRGSGTVMAVAAAVAAALIQVMGLGAGHPAATLSYVLLGPLVDIASLGQPSGWRLYARFAAAGVIANLFAYTFRMGTALLGLGIGGQNVLSFWPVALLSFIACGMVAGFLSGAARFRLHTDHNR